MIRLGYLSGGLVSLGLGALGVFLPLLPTVPFIILAAFCFARSSPVLEQWLLDSPTFGPHIRNWRTRGAISRKGKRAALGAFAVSVALGFWLLAWPVSLVPLFAAMITGSWIWTRPEA